MTRPRKLLIAALALLLVVTGLIALAALNVGALVDLAMTPGVPFDAAAAPTAPDYDEPESWSALPERDDLADRAPTGSPATDQRAAEVDVFYIHPTSYVGGQWNGPIDDPALNEATDRVATGIQASAFNGCCAVWAPRYRQANGTAFTHPTPDSDKALDLAFDDVRRAFEAFQRRRNSERPFILAGHSQGTILGERLLYEVIAPSPARRQLVAAWLIGGRVTRAGLDERAPALPPCARSDDFGCVIAWNARGPQYELNAFAIHRPDPRPLLCTNPLSWLDDGAPAAADLNLGAVFLETDDHAPRPGFADARCVEGTLVVSHIGEAPRDLPSRILDHVLGDGNYHPVEYQIFFMNIRQNAATRVAAFKAAPPP